MRFTFVWELSEYITKSPVRITYETESEVLEDILEDITLFLRGCGYSVGDLVECGEDEE